MNINDITLSQWLFGIGATLLGMLVGSVIVPRPVKGGMASIIIGGIVGALIGAFVAAQVLFYNLMSIEGLISFFLGALIGVALIKLVLKDDRRFRTDTERMVQP